MTTQQYPLTPELDKMKACRDESQAQGAFLDWLENEKGYQIVKMHKHGESCYDGGKHPNCGMRDGDLLPVYDSIEKLLAEYHGIDLKKTEAEKRAILNHLHEQQSP